MKQIRKIAVAFSVITFAGCATVPRDAGLSDVQNEVSGRSRQKIAIRQPAATDDESVRATLQGRKLDAETAVAVALANNPQVQIELAQLGLARADLIEASTIRNPIFSGEIRFPGSPAKPYEIALTQSILDIVQLPRRRAAGQATFEAAKLRVASAVLGIAADVRDDFFDLLAASQRVAANRAITEAARAAADLAQRQHQAGNITDLDLENQQAQYEQAKIDLARSEEELLLSREALIRAMALRDPSLNWQIADDFPSPAANEPNETDLIELLATRRLDIAAARHEVEAAERLLPIARTSAIGDIDAGAHRERDAEGPTTTGPALSLPIPIFNRGRAARERAETQLTISRQRLASITASASSQARAARDRLLAARSRVEYYRDVLIPRRQRIVALTQIEHNAMVAGFYQLIQARQNEASARREYIDAQRDYWIARTKLDRVLNGGR
ncbi:MAG TPA: TolC family protein [Thermoanaerobaculia bacterium]|jgi:cobalt-zinc-cadmium efflux system outer membrane protein|nr:TolC family protein [Thermoanaerobaculia bacterium]